MKSTVFNFRNHCY